MIVAFGDAVVDLFALPRGADVATAEGFVPFVGGAPGNVAIVAARLGASCRFVGAVGRDAHGDRVLAALADAGVDTGAVVRLPNRTGVTFVRVGLDGARAFLSYRHGGADLALDRAHLAALPAPPLAGATWLHLSSSALAAEPMASATGAMLAWAEERRVPISLDLNVRAHLWPDAARMAEQVRGLAARAALVKGSEEDLANLGIEPSLPALRALAPPARCVLTLAERGAVAEVGGETVAVPSPAVDVVDVTGAGDAFVGALLAGLECRGLRPGVAAWDSAAAWRPLLALACEVGARAVTALGATEGVRELSRERQRLHAERVLA